MVALECGPPADHRSIEWFLVGASAIFLFFVYQNNMDKTKIRTMNREQYEAQTVSAKRELRRLKAEVTRLKKELDKAVLDHKIALGYETTVNSQLKN